MTSHHSPGLCALQARPKLVSMVGTAHAACAKASAAFCASASLGSPLRSTPDPVFHFQSYMEDHLKNKNRLEKEWEALCAYQAEPNSSLVAQKEENVPKNRSLAVLTCTYQLRGREARVTGGGNWPC